MASTYHIRVGDLGQQIDQGVASERAHILVLLEPADGGSHTSSCDHRWRVHGELKVCENKRQRVKAQEEFGSGDPQPEDPQKEDGERSAAQVDPS